MFAYSASKRYPRTPTSCTFPSFAKLSDDILCRILFSGYLGSRLDDLVYVLLVSRRFLSLGYLATSVYVSDDWSNTEVMVKKLKNLTFLNLQYLPGILKLNMMEVLLCRKASLKVLNLRGTLVNDECLSVISSLHGLETLILGKSERLPDDKNITDTSAQHLAKLVNLTFLDLSMTNITDNTIMHISTHLTKLKHLRLQCCNGISNRSIEALTMLALQVLDVSSCVGLNAGMVDYLLQTNSLHYKLRILDISFLPQLTVAHVQLLAKMPSLVHLACRAKLDEDRVEVESLRGELEKKFENLIVLHRDQLKLPCQVHTIADLHPVVVPEGVLSA